MKKEKGLKGATGKDILDNGFGIYSIDSNTRIPKGIAMRALREVIRDIVEEMLYDSMIKSGMNGMELRQAELSRLFKNLNANGDEYDEG
jgi:hypothetical protein